MIVVDVGNTNIKVYESAKKCIMLYPISKIADFYAYLQKRSSQKIYIGCSNNKWISILKKVMDKWSLDFYFITSHDFSNLVKIDRNIDINEIGLDILATAYYINDYDYVFVGNGTAMVIIEFTNKINGVIIGANQIAEFDNMLTRTNLDMNWNHKADYFAQNTSDSLSSYINLFFIKPILNLLEINGIRKLYLSQVNKKLFLKHKNLIINECEFPSLKGYIKLVKNITKNPLND